MVNNSNIEDCGIISLSSIGSKRKGNITPVYGGTHIPFDIQRIYYLYDVPAGAERGGHAHKELHALIIAVSGSFDVILKDGQTEKIFSLNRPFYGLYIPRLIWRELTNFSSGSICLVLASLHYDENDYIRDYNKYLEIKKGEA
jgi:oxalate decarboxylase/phosphoglucose isomerase-like protein (cupin superfamily)